ncbi:MAG TPA: SWIM zinc finger family protein [Paenibacillus sp.]|uniref:SWIM zinc finger family protein n=1 Tax=Paenibacillus sp. TaxID=58172 RepID=UPI002D08C7EC|nr:SWIM zinc finger family protein [Paenibacillus sp.]HUC93743.1 SWIM zinc finger family protein [Paenibacillus sp.]
MTVTNRLAEDQTDYLERELGTRAANQILRRGYEYYRDRRVFVTEVVEGNTVYGAVNGSAVYAVTLDTDDFAYSTCTCPFEDYCKHMAAVFFQYIASAGEDAEAAFQRMTGDGEPGGGRERPAASGSSNASNAPNASGASGASVDSPPGHTDGPKAWRLWFEQHYGGVWKQCKHSLHPLQPILQELKGKARNWPKRLQRLHWLHAVAFVLEQVERAYASTDAYNRYYYEMSFTRSVDPWIGNFNELVSELDADALPDNEREWLFFLNETLRDASLNEDYTLLRWDFMYHVLWERMAEVSEWRRSERDKLTALLAEPADGGKPSAALHAALAHLDFREGRNSEAIGALSRTPFERTSLIVYAFAGHCLEEEQFDALAEWLDFIRGRLADCRNVALLRPYLKLCREADVKQPESDRWTRLMTGHLPYAYPELSAHWLERGKFREWADLQLYMGMRPDELDAQDLRIAAKAEPGLLIPLYHQAVDESIRSRNRQGYRTAVKLLKRLEKLYQSTGRGAVWSRYIGHVNRKYSRLRALQEEMKKGKLVT